MGANSKDRSIDRKTDLAILGAGPGGYVAAIRAAKLGLKPVVIEKEYLGGVCLNWGCMPTKTLFHVAELLSQIKRASDFGITISEYSLDFNKVMQRKDEIVKVLRRALEFHFKKNKIDLINGNGRLLDNHRIAVTTNSKEYLEVWAENIIIATGSSPSLVPPFNFKEEGILDNRGILSLTDLPSSILIVGGGVVGCEFANILNAFGSKVTIIEILPRILSTEAEEVSEVIESVFRRRGIEILTDASVDEVRRVKDRYVCKIRGGKELSVDKILVSVGRRANTIDIGIEEAGIETERGYIKVDSYLRTSVENIYAVGDVIGGYQLAHVASAEGKIAVENILGKRKEMKYNAVPSAIFVSPEVGTVGLSESRAREKGIEVRAGVFPFSSSGKALTVGETEGFVKIVTDSRTGEIVGAQVVGPRASDLIHELTLAMCGELVIDNIANMIHSHPTLSEAIMEAAEDCFGIAIHK
ncbi:MAG: dihydrolipoyl dehydrogenase [Actinobacteria bacterium]|nr:dihydrolipoyl dehydrogenase [Actinomycetota bacterium]